MEYALIAGGGVLVLLIAFLAYVASKPSHFRVERVTVIHAPPERVYALIEDFHHWQSWSPWEKLDPNLQRTFKGSPRGLGSIYEWLGNKKAGQGSMEITEAESPRKIVIQLRFVKPFKAHNVSEFAQSPQAGETHILWAMHGRQPFLFKVMTTVLFDMDKLVGGDFERGLASLKSVAETA